jgi:hypothetical protein
MTESKRAITAAARAMANAGMGVEDILVQLRHHGMTMEHAREIVFGSEAAKRMELRDTERARERRAS